MRINRRTIGMAASLALVAGMVTGGSLPASAEEIGACETFITQEVNVSQQIVDMTCDLWAAESLRTGESLNVPTLALAWTDVGAASTEGAAGVAGWPISATCLITGVITGPTTAYYALVGVGHTLGPAVSTTVQCSASPAALSATQTSPGPAAAAYDVTTTLPGSQLTGQRICSFATSTYLVRPLTMKTGTLPCSPL